MTKVNNLLMFIFLLFVSNLSLAQADNYLKKNVTDILVKNGISEKDLSILVENNNRSILDINSKNKLIPASISKLATTLGVLKTIPLNTKFRTALCYDKSNKNLYLVGAGDPGFVSENMWYLVNEFKRQNINKIDGNIVVDDSLFDQTRYDESRESVRVDRSYDAPVGAMSFNWNSVNIYVTPNENTKKVDIAVDPESDYFKLKNEIKISNKKNINNVLIDINQKTKDIHVYGEISLNQAEKAYYKNVSDPVLWSGLNLKSFLKQRDISVKGQIKGGLLTKDAHCSYVESKPLSALLADMNKFSNNFVAEMLTKNIAALSGEKQATLKTGVTIINTQLNQLNIPKNQYDFINPSGLTRDNRFSAWAMNQVLNNLKNDFKYNSTLMESLPFAGIDGTLKKRMKESGLQGYVKAKTGYLDGVVSLAGFAGDRKGNIYTFTFIYNGSKDEAQVRKVFDSVLEKILSF